MTGNKHLANLDWQPTDISWHIFRADDFRDPIFWKELCEGCGCNPQTTENLNLRISHFEAEPY